MAMGRTAVIVPVQEAEPLEEFGVAAPRRCEVLAGVPRSSQTAHPVAGVSFGVFTS
jgi:hypothetical protein